MKRESPRTSSLAVAALIAAAVCVGCSGKPPEDKDYASTLAADRAAKDAAFQEDNDPVPKGRKAALLPLTYFPIDPDYNVAAVLKPTSDRTIIPMPTSTGTERDMQLTGTLEFSLKGQPLKLTAFHDLSDPNPGSLSVMFMDVTSGAETYPGGRYLDLDRNATGIYVIDFNRAYNPYCYYNETYECPFPPAENRLKVPIRAGERIREVK